MRLKQCGASLSSPQGHRPPWMVWSQSKVLYQLCSPPWHYPELWVTSRQVSSPLVSFSASLWWWMRAWWGGGQDVINSKLYSGLPHWRQILYQLSHKGRPRILDWVAFPFSIGSSQPRDWTPVSCITGRFSTSWASLNIQLINLRIIFLKKLPFLIRYVHYAYKLSQITSLCLLH